MAGGLTPDAGSLVQDYAASGIRPVAAGRRGADAQGKFSSGHIDIAALMKGSHPEYNIAISPHDVISVPRAELIYVTGDVKKAGGSRWIPNRTYRYWQALSLAEGLGPRAAPEKSSHIPRPRRGSTDKEEIPVDISAILAGAKKDMPMSARDILFIPDSLPKKAGYPGGRSGAAGCYRHCNMGASLNAFSTGNE